ncbi:MAG: 4-phosphoerythronate dehydrogenase [Rikenellaceae bacterium]|nr:4-phosphoerythronate dehydrogenase [Rikenellaceae bacterium]
MRIIADQNIPYLQGVLEPYAEVTYLPGAAIGPADVRDADALIVRTRTVCDARLLEGSRVRFIGTATIGYDHIDLDYCRVHDIGVAIAAGCNSRGVLQYVAAVLAAWSRRTGRAPHEMTLGVVGVGHVGSLVADYAARWGFRVLRCDPPRARCQGGAGFVPLDRLLAAADVVTLHVPLVRGGTDGTADMAGDAFFAGMKPGALFVNSSRGEVVCEDALKRALRGNLGGCVIDTWRNEPGIDRELLDMAWYATPHVAGYSVQGKANGTATVVDALARRFGLPLADWYPQGVCRTVPDPDLTWDGMCRTIGSHFDIAAESERLRRRPGAFEELRNHYNYRTEYF